MPGPYPRSRKTATTGGQRVPLCQPFGSGWGSGGGIIPAWSVSGRILRFSSQTAASLLREVESDLLILALRGLEPERRDHFFAAMSQRAADGLRDEIESRGRVKRTDIDDAQRQIVAIAKRLVASGDLIMGAGDDEYA